MLDDVAFSPDRLFRGDVRILTGDEKSQQKQ